ncbi:MAG: hypothetical protein HY000_01885 [Planctomycetes bacterium]|nr:hypothetical protein [Planctomycetota bacterium]
MSDIRRKAWRPLVVGLLIAVTVIAGWPQAATAAEKEQPAVYVTLWFDTEDYLLPADDDATLRLAEFLTKEGVRATFKLVGEKARVLQQRKRYDVIEALKKHEIGYHTDFHSVQPTIALFLSPLGWDDGVAEFDRRERKGFDDLERIFGQKPSCYGQPGSSWGPQVFGALRQWGVPVYLDAGSHVELDGKPFWYGGVLNLYALRYTLRTGLAKSADLEAAKAPLREAYDALLGEGGGVISIYYHPCEFVHREFWDGVNFRSGANPPRAQWKIPPQKSAEETATAFANFEGYIRYLKSFPRVRFITALDAVELYRDRPRVQPDLADKVTPAISFIETADGSLAPSEILQVLNWQVIDRATGGETTPPPWKGTPFGPTSAPPALEEDLTVPMEQFVRTAQDVDDYMRRHRRVPNAVWLGSQPVSPERYLFALAEVLRQDRLPESVTFDADTDVRLATERYVSDDQPKLWGWVIFPPEFRAPEMMQLAKRQAWTLKPALLRRDP